MIDESVESDDDAGTEPHGLNNDAFVAVESAESDDDDAGTEQNESEYEVDAVEVDAVDLDEDESRVRAHFNSMFPFQRKQSEFPALFCELLRGVSAATLREVRDYPSQVHKKMLETLRITSEVFGDDWNAAAADAGIDIFGRLTPIQVASIAAWCVDDELPLHRFARLIVGANYAVGLREVFDFIMKARFALEYSRKTSKEQLSAESYEAYTGGCRKGMTRLFCRKSLYRYAISKSWLINGRSYPFIWCISMDLGTIVNKLTRIVDLGQTLNLELLSVFMARTDLRAEIENLAPFFGRSVDCGRNRDRSGVITPSADLLTPAMEEIDFVADGDGYAAVFVRHIHLVLIGIS
jgi:hypothetical protein